MRRGQIILDFLGILLVVSIYLLLLKKIVASQEAGQKLFESIEKDRKVFIEKLRL